MFWFAMWIHSYKRYPPNMLKGHQTFDSNFDLKQPVSYRRALPLQRKNNSPCSMSLQKMLTGQLRYARQRPFCVEHQQAQLKCGKVCFSSKAVLLSDNTDDFKCYTTILNSVFIEISDTFLSLEEWIHN